MGRSHRTSDCVAEVVHRDGHAVVVVSGEIDLATVHEFRCAVDHACALSCSIEVDLREATFMDATGLAVLLAVYHRLGRAHEAIVINEPPPVVRTLLEAAGVEALFDIRVGTGGDEGFAVITADELERWVRETPPLEREGIGGER